MDAISHKNTIDRTIYELRQNIGSLRHSVEFIDINTPIKFGLDEGSIAIRGMRIITFPVKRHLR